MVGVVWDAAQLEGNPFTFAEVQTLMDGVTVGGRKVSDEAEVRGLIDSTQYLYDTVKRHEFVETIDQAKRFNALIAKDQAFDAGLLRGEGDVVTDTGVDLGERGRFNPAPSQPGGENLRAGTWPWLAGHQSPSRPDRAGRRNEVSDRPMVTLFADADARPVVTLLLDVLRAG